MANATRTGLIPLHRSEWRDGPSGKDANGTESRAAINLSGARFRTGEVRAFTRCTGAEHPDADLSSLTERRVRPVSGWAGARFAKRNLNV